MKYTIKHFFKEGANMLTAKKVKTVNANTKNVVACLAKSNQKHSKMLSLLAK